MELTSSATGTWQDLVLLSAWHTCGAGGSLAREVLKFDARKIEENFPSGLAGHCLFRRVHSGTSFLKCKRTEMMLVVRVAREVE